MLSDLAHAIERVSQIGKVRVGVSGLLEQLLQQQIVSRDTLHRHNKKGSQRVA